MVARLRDPELPADFPGRGQPPFLNRYVHPAEGVRVVPLHITRRALARGPVPGPDGHPLAAAAGARQSLGLGPRGPPGCGLRPRLVNLKGFRDFDRRADAGWIVQVSSLLGQLGGPTNNSVQGISGAIRVP